MIDALGDKSPWDILIIGGGATGLGCAVDAASRGHRTLLLEGSDFAKGTSSRSTKLIHGGIRYLKQGNLRLVREGLEERGLLLKNAPHLVHTISFVVPSYSWWGRLYYGAGLKAYDLLAGKLRLGRTERLSRAEVIERVPGVQPSGLRGGILYQDGQFDDARLAISLARTAVHHKAVVLNYCKVAALIKAATRICGVRARDVETGAEYEIQSRVVINATGVFADSIRQLDEPQAAATITPSQGAHIVLDREFLPGDTALMIPKTADGRVLFAIPWNGKVIIGTTDTPSRKPTSEPAPLAEEIEFLLQHAQRYLARSPRREDIRSMWAGLRPLVKTAHASKSALIPRDHHVAVSASGLVTVTGGKWTTYRRMAEETLNTAEQAVRLEHRPCRTKELELDNPRTTPDDNDIVAQTANAVRNEMARTVEDVLARRTRLLFLDAKAAVETGPLVARAIARELDRDESWIADQVKAFATLARDYLP